jgi:hypothetical protein
MGLDALFEFIADLVDGVREALWVVVEKDLIGQESVQTGNRCRVGLA